ncbi:MAG TPA: hypothetical protein VD963_10515 [Phycisphaerales bacterium]|nr:hypothetical protein [Phycisphaerales bacterium]
MKSGSGSGARARRGMRGASRGIGAFTLMEMMIVVVIIVIVLAIVFPALSGARNAARKASTQALIQGLGAASGQFVNDNRRAPGHFQPADMGNQANTQRGFSSMQNVLVDLMSGMSSDQQSMTTVTDPCAHEGRIRVGPMPTQTVVLDTQLIGGSSAGGTRRAYFAPDGKNLVRQCGPGQRVSSVPDHLAMPELVDAWKNPILAWQEDVGAVSAVTFSIKETDGSAAQRARFYWAQNAALLSATSLGGGGRQQAAPPASEWSATPHSLLGLGHDAQMVDNGANTGSLTGILGHPDYPDPNAPAGAMVPAQSRGELMFHSAGADGIYFSSADRGGKVAAAASPAWVVKYASRTDPVAAFDDVLVKGQ